MKRIRCTGSFFRSDSFFQDRISVPSIEWRELRYLSILRRAVQALGYHCGFVNVRRDLFVVSALFLFLELAFIRWFPAEVLFLTFFTNTVLLASFLGLSLGCLAARQQKNYLALTPLMLLIAIAAGAGMEWVRLALQNILDVGSNATSPQMVFFGTEYRTSDVAKFVIPIEWVAGIFFVLIASTMIGLGQLLGRRFQSVPNAVEAYTINIGGSLAGVLLFNLCSWWLSPVWWFGIVAAGLVYFLL